jgi:biopolymer transport protein ExbD/biopolymer transport protein ExbB/TolQ
MWHIFTRLFTEGGWVLYPIFAVSVLVWFLGMRSFFFIARMGGSRRRFFKAVELRRPGPTGFAQYDALLSAVLRAGETPASAYTRFLSAVAPRLEYGLSTITACAVIAPLLGLLGTISGMNEMFQVIGEFGFGNPTIMANGISMALQATLTGLGVAVASIFIYNYLFNKKTRLLHCLAGDGERLFPRGTAPSRKGKTMESDFQLVPQEFEKPEINLAPFVDTIMILLIFFVVTANLYVETGIDVSKPKAQSAHTMGQKAILIGLTREGTVHIYGRQVTLDKVRMLIQREAARQADLSVVIVADRDASVGKAVEVMDQCALGGAPRVSIAAGKD